MITGLFRAEARQYIGKSREKIFWEKKLRERTKAEIKYMIKKLRNIMRKKMIVNDRKQDHLDTEDSNAEIRSF